jgi:hypothetical protein
MELFDLTQQQFMTFASVLAGAAIVITLILWMVRRLRLSSPGRRIEKIIKVEGQAYTKNIILSDGMYGFLFVDYLVLMRGNIIALDVHHLEGYIFGGDQIEQWAQVINSKSNKFKNPLYRVRLVQQQIKQLVKDADVEARVIFGNDSSFPKGVPVGVLRQETLRDDLNALDKNDYLAESMSKIWDEIMAIAKQHKQRYLQEAKNIKAK